ncbi:CHAP domain-containing protein [Sphingobacterium sp. arapr2]|nr:CHAP domain-containing protein [Sphingobacterium prati]
MHYLFFGVLSVAVLAIARFGNRAIAERNAEADHLTSYTAVSCPATGLASRSALRQRIVDIALNEIGVKEATGNNDGARVEEYLSYTGLGKGYAWCAAFVSWCYGKAGRDAPRNAWSPALFPNARCYTKEQIQREAVRPADLFGIYNSGLRRIDHVGIVRKLENRYILTVEGNVANRVLSKRRALATVYAFSNWLD